MEKDIRWYIENIRFAVKVKNVFSAIVTFCVLINIVIAIMWVSLTENVSSTLSLTIFMCWLVTLTIVVLGLKVVFKCEDRIKEWRMRKHSLMKGRD